MKGERIKGSYRDVKDGREMLAAETRLAQRTRPHMDMRRINAKKGELE